MILILNQLYLKMILFGKHFVISVQEKQKKDAQKVLIHPFEWNGPEEPFFKDVFKDYLIEPKKFDFFCYTEDDQKEVHVATHEKNNGKSGASQPLFTLDLTKIK